MGDSVIRLLKAEEIECRPATVSEKGVSLLLYKDARVDQRILDETFGIFGWKRSHQCLGGSLYCTVEVFDRGTSTWVSKQDVGTTGAAEKEKSQASDSFKRACFNWGIGRELYTAPFIWIPSGKAHIRKQGEKFCCDDYFSVGYIGYNGDREIDSLVIVNNRGKTVYEMGKGSGKVQDRETDGGASLTRSQIGLLKKELKRTGVELRAVQDRYQIGEPEQMTEDIYKKVMTALARTKSAGAA